MWGPGIDQPIVWEEGPTYTCGQPGAAALFVLHADHEGSVIARADCWGNQIGVNTYDEHGTPAPGNAARFGYTGQAWIPELGLWYYKARVYSPTLGRFLQTDPVGYKDQINLYEYVGDDPLDGRDPSGLCPPIMCRNDTDPFGMFGLAGTASSGSLLGSSGGAAGLNVASQQRQQPATLHQSGVATALHAAGYANDAQTAAAKGVVLATSGAKGLKAVEGGVKGLGVIGQVLIFGSAFAQGVDDVRHGVSIPTALKAGAASVTTTESFIFGGAFGQGSRRRGNRRGGDRLFWWEGAAPGLVVGSFVGEVSGGVLDAMTGASERAHDAVINGAP